MPTDAKIEDIEYQCSRRNCPGLVLADDPEGPQIAECEFCGFLLNRAELFEQENDEADQRVAEAINAIPDDLVGGRGVYCYCYAHGVDPRVTKDMYCVHADAHAAGLNAAAARSADHGAAQGEGQV